MSSKLKFTLSIFIIFSLVGFFLSVLSLYQHTAQNLGFFGPQMFCKLSEKINCAPTNASEYSYFLGVPVAAWGMGYYLFLVVFSILIFSKQLILEKTVAGILFLICFISIVFSLHLFLASYLHIGSFCPTCIGMYAVNVILLSFVWISYSSCGFWNLIGIGITSVFFTFPLNIFGSCIETKRARISAVFLLLLFIASVLSPKVFAMFLHHNKTTKPVSHQKASIVSLWETSPYVPLQVSTEGIFKDFTVGSDNASIVLVEFSDFECPGCEAFHLLLKELENIYEGDLKVVFKNYPLDNKCNPKVTEMFHLASCFAAEFSRCAGEQGKFWEVSDYIFSLGSPQDNETQLSRQGKILDAVKSFNMDGDAINECLNSKRHVQKIKEDISEGERLNIEQTPTVYVNNRLLPVITRDTLTAVFDSIIEKKRERK